MLWPSKPTCRHGTEETSKESSRLVQLCKETVMLWPSKPTCRDGTEETSKESSTPVQLCKETVMLWPSKPTGRDGTEETSKESSRPEQLECVTPQMRRVSSRLIPKHKIISNIVYTNLMQRLSPTTHTSRHTHPFSYVQTCGKQIHTGCY